MSRSHRVFLCHLNHPNRLSARGLTADQAFVMPWYERFRMQDGRPPNPGKVAPSGARRRKCLRKPPHLSQSVSCRYRCLIGETDTRAQSAVKKQAP
jgi:hypothetical protein